MKRRVGDYITAALLILLGCLDIYQPVYYSKMYARYIDLTGVNIPLGLGFIIIGIVLLWRKNRKIDGG
jgi:hypothetical protein